MFDWLIIVIFEPKLNIWCAITYYFSKTLGESSTVCAGTVLYFSSMSLVHFLQRLHTFGCVKKHVQGFQISPGS
jgi:hypothetical protein